MINSKHNEWCKHFLEHVPNQIGSKIYKFFLKINRSIICLEDGQLEKEAEKEQNEKDNITPQEHE